MCYQDVKIIYQRIFYFIWRARTQFVVQFIEKCASWTIRKKMTHIMTFQTLFNQISLLLHFNNKISRLYFPLVVIDFLLSQVI